MGLNAKWIVTILISIVVVFYLVSAILPEAQDVGDTFGVDNQYNCQAVSCYWNASATDCVSNNSATSTDCTTTPPKIPLSGLFTGTGVIFLLVSVGVLLWVIALVRKKK